MELAADPRPAIIDRSIYEDAYIFARALQAMGNLSERDYATYRKLFDLVVKKLPPPSLLIHLKAPVPVLLKRIQRRGRAIEGSITGEYLTLLESLYDEWLQSFDLCPVLTIRTDDLDFVHQTGALDFVIERILDKLSGKEEMIL